MTFVTSRAGVAPVVRKEFLTEEELHQHFETEAPAAYNYFSMEMEKNEDGGWIIKVEYEPALLA